MRVGGRADMTLGLAGLAADQRIDIVSHWPTWWTFPFLLLSRHLQVGALTARQFEQERLPFLPVIEVNQYSAACAFAERGLGVAILDSMSGLYARRHGLRVVPVDVEGGLDLAIVWPLNRGLGRVARQLESGLVHELSHTTE